MDNLVYGHPVNDIGHFVFGFISGVTGREGMRVGAAAFSGYELSKLYAGEALGDTFQKFLEFGAGMLLAKMIGGSR